MTIQELAGLYQGYLTAKETGNEERGVIIVKKEGAPEDVTELVQHAHGDMLPDDYRYRFISDVLERIEETDEGEEDEGHVELESDVYTYGLLKWVSSNLNRTAYVDEVVEEQGFNGFVEALMAGQVKEKEEVYFLVLEWLKEKLEEEEVEDGED